MKFSICEGHDVEIKLNFFTLWIYEQEFNSDLIRDALGVVRVELPQNNSEDGEDSAITLDFQKSNWTGLVKALWAACKCADSSTAPFKVWAEEFENINMFNLTETFSPLIFQEFFRAGVSADLSE